MKILILTASGRETDWPSESFVRSFAMDAEQLSLSGAPIDSTVLKIASVERTVLVENVRIGVFT